MPVEKPVYLEDSAAGLTQYQRNALTVLRARLNPDDPAFMGSNEVRIKLGEIGLYLGSWVLPLLDVLAGGGYRGLRDDVARDAVSVRRRRRGEDT